ncbi:MAG: hypothetical protein A3D67_00295 [Candidatus Lloydbacteria bacterium RIFCSPHIGHO2_02_FULL_51_22]|uniref:Methyltransferase domain-containing protein n=2 Tax=Candidatus Lloydiibacteriota TaxID=1817910 RepID=A0A1G2DGF7_9BACT|nr:MAG: hypothetical protein A3D67_00295 [Candidatus Lloydbacteria bacterium RIFCSPHIGHO2_02_FULL_51_22]OGZ15310.1 MAG: hypothetical protein A3J08_00840 [Candidatus Lloydbacteria bacterium RIFCSPLOWO2_02_FULL_51_11]
MKRKAGQFWNKEYKAGRSIGGRGAHLALSLAPSEDLEKFLRWYEREYRSPLLSARASVLDLGCGNGRNLIYCAKEFGARGLGIDSSSEAITQAKSAHSDLPLSYIVQSIGLPLPASDHSQDLVLDMMTSHFLNKEERINLYREIMRVLKPSRWLFLKTFLLDEDAHAARLLREHPAEESGSYIHPEFGGVEHVFTEEEIREDLAPYFEIEKITKSHQHKGPRGKRRSMSIYARKR